MATETSGILLAAILVLGCLSVCTAYFSQDTIDDAIDKRNYQRRSFLESFCAKRCNIGRGGNVCKCNGFHFAGKRTSETDSIQENRMSHDLLTYILKNERFEDLENDQKTAFSPLTKQELVDNDEELQRILPIILQQSLQHSNLDLAAKLLDAVSDRRTNGGTEADN